MRTRTSILCVSIGVLLSAVVPAPPGFEGKAPAQSRGTHIGPPLETCTVSQADTRVGASFIERLVNAYSSPSPSVTPPVDVEEPTLWLARAIYSETKLPHEQELVAWVIRNRVETQYRGKTTYRAVVLDPYQFSAFNPGSSKRSFLMKLGPKTPIAGWQQALWVAYYVRHADPAYRPFPIKTRHFYSERSMEGRRTPYWAEESRFLDLDASQYQYVTDDRRFRFYKQIS